MKIIKKQLGDYQNGDTIVEVLIAIAIAAFAIGLSYATAQRSLQQSITAREHNEALNIMENQIADLKIRFQSDPDFTDNFAAQNHFCLDDNAKAVGDTSPPWAIYQNWNNTGFNENSPLATSTGPNSGQPYFYNSSNKQGCQRGTDIPYYVDITTSPSSATDAQTKTLFHVTVRWEKIGGGPHNQASLDYKLNGSSASPLGFSTTSSFRPGIG